MEALERKLSEFKGLKTHIIALEEQQIELEASQKELANALSELAENIQDIMGQSALVDIGIDKDMLTTLQWELKKVQG